jgi:hypothetical protein
MASLTYTPTTLGEVLAQLNLSQYSQALIEAGYDMLNRFDTENNTVKELTEELKEDVPMKKPHARALVRYLFSQQHQPLLSAPGVHDADDDDLPIAEAIPMSRGLNNNSNPPSFDPAVPSITQSDVSVTKKEMHDDPYQAVGDPAEETKKDEHEATKGLELTAQGETKTNTSTSSLPSAESTEAIVMWLQVNSTIKVKNDLTSILTEVGVSTVLELAMLGEEKQLEVMKAMKKINQKKWISSDVSETLKLYLQNHNNMLDKENENIVLRACGTTAIEEWLNVLQLSGDGAKMWLEEFGIEVVVDLNELEEEEINNLIQAAKDNGGERDGRRVTMALEAVGCNICPEGALRVEAGLHSFSNAVKEAKRRGIDCIFLLNGVHDEGGKTVIIDFALKVIGQNKDDVKIRAGLVITGKKEEDVFFSDCTVTGAKGHGVLGQNGASMHLNNVCVEKCGGIGVAVVSTTRNTMTDCNVNNNKSNGVYVSGGCMVIDGSATTIHHNVTGGDSRLFGLHTWNSSSSIHLKSLTKESISTNNGGGGNYGGDGTIKTI